jgi:N-acetylmuramoyl-L-alanine amidase
MYKDYSELSKTDKVLINVLEKETVSPVYVNYNFTNIKKGSLVTLSSNTKDATIYYTTDGSTPNTNSTIYQYPIKINEDVTIKAIAIRKNMYNSEINTYNFHVGEKKLVVYLSPSNQNSNYGAKNSGFSTEKTMMNKITDILQSYLEENGVKVYRNNPNTDINTWLSESNSVKSDLHLAIHSNGSESHNAYGIEMYVDNASSKSLSIANKIYNNLYKIYPYKDNYSNRGVKYSEKSLGEANDSFISCGTLIEIAYHDNYNDAKWIADNLNEIAKNIGDSILEYYQVNLS